MTAQANTRLELVAKPRLALARAIERHKVAKAAYEAAGRDDDDPLFDAICEALLGVAYAPVAGCGELAEKLVYLFAEERRDYGAPDELGDFGATLAAVALYARTRRG